MSRLIWLDLETTGLTENDVPLEIAVVVTENFPPWSEVGFLHAPLLLPNWVPTNPRVIDMHTKSGLLADLPFHAVTEPEYSDHLDLVEDELVDMLGRHVPNPGDWVLAGTGTDRFDRRLLERWFPRFAAMLFYKGLDISPLREALRIVGRPDLAYRTHDDIPHRALADTRRAIAEWAHYARLLTTIGCPDCGAHRDDECREGCTAERTVLA